MPYDNGKRYDHTNIRKVARANRATRTMEDSDMPGTTPKRMAKGMAKDVSKYFQIRKAIE